MIVLLFQQPDSDIMAEGGSNPPNTTIGMSGGTNRGGNVAANNYGTMITG
jgi:hypothetical protein